MASKYLSIKKLALICLTIDIGNTLIKAAVFDDGQLQHVFKFENMEGLELYCQDIEINTPIMVSNVTNNSLASFYERFNTFIVLNHQTKLPIKNLYKTPETLGNDRLATVVGAWSRFPNQNSLVIDSGTCVKYDFISSAGEYEGGSISPGLSMRFKSLHDYTQKLPLVEKSVDYSSFGNNTESALISGVMFGIQSEMQGFIDYYAQKDEKLNIIMTGGDAVYFSDKLKGTIFADYDLVFKGLFEILKHNVSQL